MSVSVRQAGMADLETVAPLFDQYRQFYGQPADPVLARAFLHERFALLESAIFLALDAEGQAIGFTQLYPSFSSVSARRTWILNDLFVLPSARGKGAGSALLNAARVLARASGAKRLDLATACDNPAQKLYEARGYVRQEGFHHYSLSVE